jgi:hypothetical protein
MKVPGLILAMALCASMFGDDARLSSRIQSVYILEMSNSLDQHLASRISSSHVLWVVLDPAGADAVLTDSLDKAFWVWMQQTYPPGVLAALPDPGREGASARDNPPPANQRGTVFLVDPRRRVVLWSMYEFPKNPTPTELDRTAVRITNQLKAAFGRR